LAEGLSPVGKRLPLRLLKKQKHTEHFAQRMLCGARIPNDQPEGAEGSVPGVGDDLNGSGIGEYGHHSENIAWPSQRPLPSVLGGVVTYSWMPHPVHGRAEEGGFVQNPPPRGFIDPVVLVEAGFYDVFYQPV